ncbi:MAG: PilZ domain-containing protein [Desulfobacterales bacterium]|nr:MAG: PilZ domain-containing protein [Desulfobacterales bacterium]UCD90898.1 MAG: PilZ domain-containing protein [Desulfobacterales bacterium]
MTDTGNELSVHEVKSRILQNINDMPEIDRQRLPSILFDNQSEAENKKLLSIIIAVLPEPNLRKLWAQLEDWHTFRLTEMRGHPRRPSFISAECLTKGILFSEFIKDISNGGVFIQTDGNFFIGQQISLTFSLPHTKKDIAVSGEVARIDSDGIGVKFNEPLNLL